MIFSGYPEHVERTVRELGLPEGTKYDAMRQPAVWQIASLVSQAGHEPHPDLLRRVRELAQGLSAAAHAAASMRALIDPEPLPVAVAVVKPDAPKPIKTSRNTETTA